MDTFRNWLENEDKLQTLYDALIQSIKYSIYDNNLRIYTRILQALQNAGWQEEAEELEMLKPTAADIMAAHSTNPTGFTIGAVLQHKNLEKPRQSFEMSAHQWYELRDRIFEKIEALRPDIGN